MTTLEYERVPKFLKASFVSDFGRFSESPTAHSALQGTVADNPFEQNKSPGMQSRDNNPILGFTTAHGEA